MSEFEEKPAYGRVNPVSRADYGTPEYYGDEDEYLREEVAEEEAAYLAYEPYGNRKHWTDEEAEGGIWTGPKSYEIHDSGSKSVYEDGMQRDNTAGKPRFDLAFPKDVPYEEQLLTRVAMQYSVGGEKYGDRNWEKSSSEESLAHHEAALMRHVIKFLTGTEDGEDHGAAIVWNVNAIDLTRRNIKRKREIDESLHSFAYPDRTPIYNWPHPAEERNA